MSLKIVTGGTTDAADGTLVSSGNKLTIAALNTPIDAHVRADDNTWTQDVDVTLPAELELSYNGGSTWKGIADNPIRITTGVGIGGTDVGDLNYPIKLRQIVAASTSAGTFTTDATFTACTALADVGSFAAAGATATTINVSWAAVTDRTRYQVDRATNSGFTTGVTLGVYTGTGTSFTDTGLTTGTTYYYRIKAVGTLRFSDSASYATANAAPANPIFASDDFNTGSGDLVGTTPDVGGNWTDGSDSGSPSPVYASNRIRQEDAPTSFTYVATTPASADYTVEVDVTPQSGGSGGVAGVCGRKNAATGLITAYGADYYDHATAGSRQWRLYKVVAGTTTVLGTYTENIGTTTKRLKLGMVGTSIALYVDGVSRVSVTDSAVTAAGRPGVIFGAAGSPTTNAIFLDNFVASL